MKYLPTDAELRAIAERLPPETWERRVAAADEEAAVLAVVLARVQGGESRRSVLSELLPERPLEAALRRLRRFERGGRDGLIDRRAPRSYRVRVTDEVRGVIRGLAHAHPEMYSEELTARVNDVMGLKLASSTVRRVLADLGLSRQRGRPRGGGGAEEEPVEVKRLALAGAELFKGLDTHVGAVRALTDAIDAHLDALPAPTGEVRDDRAHRDERGRFQASYNQKDQRTDPGLGARSGSVEQQRMGKDLPAMQVVERSKASRHRKDLALTLLPVLVEGARWSSLRHWQGQHLGDLVGYPYQPASLDKYTRELKYAGVAEVSREAVASFWFDLQGTVKDAATSAVVLYADGSTKPLWTSHFSRSTKVSKTGRVQPATTTFFLHSGAGTPLIYESYSGRASLPEHVPDLLRRYEAAAGEGTARRLLVVDRECHAAQLFKDLDRAGLHYMVPLRRSSTGSNARWEEVGPWTSAGGDESDATQVRGGRLSLNDSKAPKEPLSVRTITRRQGPDDEGATWATNAPADLYDDHNLLRMYQERWRHQEHVFRDANGRVGLDVHHGYGKRKVLNVAVLDRLEKLRATLRRARADLEAERAAAQAHEEAAELQREANARVEAYRAEQLAELDQEMAAGGRISARGRQTYSTIQILDRGLPAMRQDLAQHEEDRRAALVRATALETRIAKLSTEEARLESRTEIYTVDVELDEIMTAYKLTFLNLSRLLMRDYLGVDWQIDTLIRSVLTLPGERRLTPSTSTIVIDYQARDPDAMAAAQRACERLNALQLTSGEDEERRQLRFELAPPPSGGSD